MAINYRTYFAYRIDLWDADGENVIEHLAGVEDPQVAMATYVAACQRWPKAPITLCKKLPISPIFTADKVTLAVSREKDGKLRLVYAASDDATVVQPDGCGQARSGEGRILPRRQGGSADPP